MAGFLKTGGLMLLALIFAGLAGWGTLSYLNSREAELRQAAASMDGPAVEVVVASQAMAPGGSITLENMAIAEVPQKYLPQDAIAPEEFKFYAKKAILVPLDPGRPLLKSYISGLSHQSSFSDHLKEGWRAMTLSVDELNAVAGMLEAGDFIDLVIAGEQENGEAGTKGYVLRRLMERVEVLATGTMTRLDAKYAKANGVYPDEPFYGTITIAVPAYLVTEILMARENDTLNILLRHPIDESIASYPGGSRGLQTGSFGIENIGGKSNDGVLEVRYEEPGFDKSTGRVDLYRLPQKFQGAIAASQSKNTVESE
ncbi:pilus assembly protein CpaB [Marinobacter daqiaonensis]|uniref:Pilus assembly protein CpaB n=1 Tax=Marinobacter daqiaonensis TaxID=650891 RepID=A0A1I6I7U0_9GAMM|nr:Flp pilus assembly protein CpaB [Marinobacter daqiaonensis]SFR62751.1 pilus assembly protein CpaB [Marinobacter daqiaonensis]